MSDGPSREKYVVLHSNLLEPKDFLRFIHFDGFTADWKDLRLNDDDLRSLQITIMVNPRIGPVVPGTGGIRKMRFAPPSSGRGKRGGIRVLYAIYPDHSVCVLAAAFAKNEREDITAQERKMLTAILREIEADLNRERKTDRRN